jgi:hypothetical protein
VQLSRQDEAKGHVPGHEVRDERHSAPAFYEVFGEHDADPPVALLRGDAKLRIDRGGMNLADQLLRALEIRAHQLRQRGRQPHDRPLMSRDLA